ncbi:hypothetical protein [Leptospira sp. GIMC2001]|uniref:hypothetical protein n=1 Tax=Leptospira sp. GIMC2001 TaxID=1513297 RepID=UPI002349DA0C|nr:hypothetical protein [Leptospira sp. GIMC2001]WCL47816.1 hypothetical protein O4O04_00740 [Leptospira sp. GIMC2001]
MIFTKQELLDNYPLQERKKLEKAKSQNSVVFWINELISSQVSGAEDVPSLISLTKNVTDQLESLYADMEVKNWSSEVESLTDQVVSLYEEKDELFSAFPGAQSTGDIIDMIKQMEEQLIELYKEKESN